MCAWSEGEEILGAICRRDPNRALGQFCHPHASRGLVLTRAQRPSPRSFAAAAPGDSLRAEVKPRSAARLPRAPPSPLSLPPLGGPQRGTGGALRDETWGRGGWFASSERKAPPPQSGGRGLLINSASAQTQLPRPAVGSARPEVEVEQPEPEPGPKRARAAALRAAAGRRIMHTG